MTHITRFSILAAVTAGGICLMSALSNEAVAQIRISVPGVTRSYYNGYSAHYGPASGYRYGRRAYSGYGKGPYGYGSSVRYGYPSYGSYGYRSGASYSTNYGSSYLRGGSYRSVYTPQSQSTRYYVPYGYRGY